MIVSGSLRAVHPHELRLGPIDPRHLSIRNENRLDSCPAGRPLDHLANRPGTGIRIYPNSQQLRFHYVRSVKGTSARKISASPSISYVATAAGTRIEAPVRIGREVPPGTERTASPPTQRRISTDRIAGAR